MSSVAQRSSVYLPSILCPIETILMIPYLTLLSNHEHGSGEGNSVFLLTCHSHVKSTAVESQHSSTIASIRQHIINKFLRIIYKLLLLIRANLVAHTVQPTNILIAHTTICDTLWLLNVLLGWPTRRT